MAGVEEISGIGDVQADKLKAAGINTVEALLEAGATPKGRSDLEAATGIGGKLILGWVNKADLFRVKGIGTQYSDLLEAVGVDTVVELSQRRADHLTTKLAEVNEEMEFVRHLPSESQVAEWIEAAKALPRVMTY